MRMEETFRPLEVKRRDPNLLRLTQVGLLIACLGAVLVLFHPFGSGVVGLVLAALGTVLAARGGLGKTWFWAVAGGTIVAILSRLIAEGSEVLGGWLAVFSCLAILLAATVGYPTREEDL
jgi:hypothetical protein